MTEPLCEMKRDWTATMLHAIRVASTSPDPSTQNGAVLVTIDLWFIDDCNRFPDNVEYTDERWERPLKYSIVEHAERNVIFDAARNGIKTRGATLVCPWAACADCARAIIQSGIVRLVRLPVDDPHAHWGESISIADTMLLEAGVEIVDFTPAKPFGITLRRDGKELML